MASSNSQNGTLEAFVTSNTSEQSRICDVQNSNSTFPLYDPLKTSKLQARDIGFTPGDLKWGKNDLSKTSPTYIEICKVCKESAEEGYFCYEELFVWAADLIQKAPSIIQTLRYRFPLVLIDEAQDTCEEQANLIHQIFGDGDNPVICQRFGDPNQAIYGSGKAPVNPDVIFPRELLKIDLPTSHRFDQRIANLADPLGILPYKMKGVGPKVPLASRQDIPHTIFMFRDEQSSMKVLPSYGDLLLQHFNQDELSKGTFKAVGHIHKKKPENNPKHFPAHVGHYWSDYDPLLSRPEPKPETFVQYVFAGLQKSETEGECRSAVEKIAEGIVRLVELGKAEIKTGKERNKHRWIEQRLRDNSTKWDQYFSVILDLGIHRGSFTKAKWEQEIKSRVIDVAEAIAGQKLSGKGIESFLNWREGPISAGAGTSLEHRGNHQIFQRNGKEVKIQIGSIHSVKGETHTGTLVLETYHKAHSLAKVQNWLTGKKKGCNLDSTDSLRLMNHYVAMTRPTHILCMALYKPKLNMKNESKALSAFEKQGWQIIDLL